MFPECWGQTDGRKAGILHKWCRTKQKLPAFPNSLCVYEFLSTITLKLQCYTRLHKDESIFLKDQN